ncbi:MAG: hypothetical protein DRP03_02625 [Candidatus Aenigmatarchaeota archaeon]|nr:MAG: hypothetical protein DRP03_02625 [Candidatus Aenigmarchaeota archaeon]
MYTDKKVSYISDTGKEDSFDECLAENLERQIYEFPAYAAFFSKFAPIDKNEIQNVIENGDLYLIPPLPAEYFKKSNDLFRELSKLEKEGRWNVSSSTSGDPSYVYRTPLDEEVMKQSYIDAFSLFPKTDETIVFSPPESFIKKASQRFSLGDGKDAILQAAIIHEASKEIYNNMYYAARPDYLAMIIKKMLGTLKGPILKRMSKDEFRMILDDALVDKKILGFGASVILLYPMVLEYTEPGDYDFHDNLYITTGAGGWSGRKGTLRGEPIDKKKYIRDMEERLGIPVEHIMDVYAFTENFAAYRGLWDEEYGDFVFEVPDNVKAYAINDKGRPAKAGEYGVFAVYSPYGHEGFAGAAIKQNDKVMVVETNEDGSLRRFTHIERIGKDGRGCAFEMSTGVR